MCNVSFQEGGPTCKRKRVSNYKRDMLSGAVSPGSMLLSGSPKHGLAGSQQGASRGVSSRPSPEYYQHNSSSYHSSSPHR